MPKQLTFAYYECGYCWQLWKTRGGVEKHQKKNHPDQEREITRYARTVIAKFPPHSN